MQVCIWVPQGYLSYIGFGYIYRLLSFETGSGVAQGDLAFATLPSKAMHSQPGPLPPESWVTGVCHTWLMLGKEPRVSAC